MCLKHYSAAHYAKRLPTEWHRPTVIERFLDRVDKRPDGCWVWNGSLFPTGYGQFQPERKRSSAGGLAHRWAYILLVGPIPVRKSVLHRCDNKSCVNPDHLFLGSQADNIADKVAKGRQARGERHGMSTVSDETVRAIQAALARGVCQAEIGRWYGVSRQYVGFIRRGITRQSQ